MLRKLLALVALLAASLFVSPMPAEAGISADSCFNGTGGTEVPILQTPWTIGAEIRQSGASRTVDICFATSPVGYGGSQLAGGIASYTLGPDGIMSSWCWSDHTSTVKFSCNGTTIVSPTYGTVALYFTWLTVDTTATPQTVLSGTGVAVLSPTHWGVTVPCVFVQGTQLVPGCGTRIV